MPPKEESDDAVGAVADRLGAGNGCCGAIVDVVDVEGPVAVDFASQQPGRTIVDCCRDLLRPNGAVVGSEVASRIRGCFRTAGAAATAEEPTLESVVPGGSADAFLASVDGRRPVTHSEVSEFLREFRVALRSTGVRRGHRVALVLPNGPELALAVLACANCASCVPLSAAGARSELAADLRRCGADLVVGPYSAGPLPTTSSSAASGSSGGGGGGGDDDTEQQVVVDGKKLDELVELGERYAVMAGSSSGSSSSGRDWTVHGHVKEIADELEIPFVGLVPDPARSGPFKLWFPPARKSAQLRQSHDFQFYDHLEKCPHHQLIDSGECDDETMRANSGNDEALVLFTSGTTGNKKLVPHVIGDILTAATTVAMSWNLIPEDVNCNLMPLFHVGGIIRQVFAPLLSGGSVICCPSFDADLFWALLERRAFNWYYAAPTMHQIILETGKGIMGQGDSKNRPPWCRLKMIANAAGGLLPSLAVELRETFDQARVLPSYGMTEAMPISSPPFDYDLDRPGTSGVPVGPECAVLNTSTLEPLPAGTEGPICVRGEPCFRGYGVLADDPAGARPESFMEGGWFNTGDLGYMDADGYLFITGRSKEVINRGGEIISPMEVEEAVLAHPDVRACAAFSASHSVLQEMVGIVVVPEEGRPRSLDLPALQAFVADRLATPKWPQCLVFMKGGLPKSHTNKLLRVKLGQRLGLPEFTDDMPTWARIFEAECPPQGTPLSAAIPCQPVAVDAGKVQAALRAAAKSEAVWVVPFPQRPGALVAHVGAESGIDRLELIEAAIRLLHRYEVPSHVCFAESTDNASVAALATIVPEPKDAVASILQGDGGASDPIVEQLQEMFMDLLGIDYIPAPDADFFHMGGSSMKASQLASKVRKSFGVPCSGAEIFHHAKCVDLAGLVRSRTGEVPTDEQGGGKAGGSPADRESHNAPFAAGVHPPESSCGSAFVQLFPMFLIYPAWQISRYLLFFAVILAKSRLVPDYTDRDMITFLVAYLIFYLGWITIAPLAFILIKWIVIGRYQEGRYKIWGSYYLKWWLVDICRKLILRGVYGYTDVTLRWYYRMLGAKIEPGARIAPECEMAEFDLVTVGRNSAVELCTLRGFGVDNGAMILGKVRVGHESSVGIRTVVAPFTSVPDGQHLGPVTSSYDATPGKALHPKHARVNRQFFPKPSLGTQLFIGAPITFFVQAFAQVPPMLVLYSLLWYKSRETSENFFMNWNELMDWLCDPRRIPFFFGIRIARALFSPFFYMFAALVCKWTVIGKFEPGPRKDTEWENFRLWLAAALFPRRKVQAVTDLIGRHYEVVSVLYRLLGARVGKRVFWPGNQPICNGLFDLLDIGDDVVFGSRSTLLCASTDRYDKISLCAGANVSDNCVVLPGTVVGRNAVLGSNSVTLEGMYLPAGSVWFGSAGCESTCLEAGDGSDASFYQPLADENGVGWIASEALNTTQLPMTGDEGTIRPFGKAFYLGQSKGYHSMGILSIVLYTWLNRVFSSIFHTLPLLGAVQFAGLLLYCDDFAQLLFNSVSGGGNNDGARFNRDWFLGFERDFDNDGHRHSFFDVYNAVLVCYIFTHFLRVVGWLIVELSAKWGFMGRRKAGRYNYDTSNYAQRWELYQLTAKIRKIGRLNLLQFISGTPFMSWYFRWNGGNVGKDCCLYPAGADPFMPEPDLVTIGDRAVVDCASIVCHLNTRGNFELAPITIERDCTLRTRSRVQQGVHMEAGSQLLEKSIAMTGEVLDGRSVWQGAPATLWFRYPEVSYAPPELQMGQNGHSK